VKGCIEQAIYMSMMSSEQALFKQRLRGEERGIGERCGDRQTPVTIKKEKTVLQKPHFHSSHSQLQLISQPKSVPFLVGRPSSTRPTF
jgi:hypothetical protein